MTQEPTGTRSEKEQAERIAQGKKQLWLVAIGMVISSFIGTALLLLILWLVLK